MDDKKELLVDAMIGIAIIIMVFIIGMILGMRTNTKIIDGDFSIRYHHNNRFIEYRTNRITFHQDDQMISFHDKLTDSEIVLKDYIIEVNGDE